MFEPKQQLNQRKTEVHVCLLVTFRVVERMCLKNLIQEIYEFGIRRMGFFFFLSVGRVEKNRVEEEIAQLKKNS